MAIKDFNRVVRGVLAKKISVKSTFTFDLNAINI